MMVKISERYNKHECPYTRRILSDLGFRTNRTIFLDAIERLPIDNTTMKAIVDLFKYESFKLEILEELALEVPYSRSEDCFLFDRAQGVLHLSLSKFQKIEYTINPSIRVIDAQWNWSALKAYHRSFKDWHLFLKEHIMLNNIYLKYKHGLNDFTEQSSSGWFFILDSFRGANLSMEDVLAAIFDNQEASVNLSQRKVKKILEEIFKYLIYWGFLVQADDIKELNRFK